jgi:glycerol-3-phosphate acyltransferase PlsY
MIFDYTLIIFGSYLFGSIPFGLIFSKMLGYGDIRKQGSGNIGATNAMRVGGRKLGILTLIFDMLKAIIPLVIMQGFIRDQLILAIAGCFMFIGHIFPIWLKFNGGKGVATCLAVMLILSPKAAIAFLLVVIAVFYATRIVSISSLSAMLIATMFSCFVEPIPYIAMNILMFSLMVIRHKDNITRLLNGTELGLKV